MKPKEIFAICFIININLAFGQQFLNGYNTEEYDHEFVEANLNPHSDDIFNVNTFAFGQNYSLNLIKLQDIFHENFTLMSLELDSDGQPILQPMQQNEKNVEIYEDPVHGSVLHVSHNEDDKGFQVEGLLTPDVSIIPVVNHHKRNSHVIIRSNNNREKRSTNLSPSQLSSFNALRDDVTPEIKLPESITAELLVILDFKNAKALQFDSERIKKYLAIFWNAVNKRFALLDKPKIQLSLVNSIIIKDINLQPYIEQARVHSDGLNLVEQFQLWGGLASDMFKRFYQKNGDGYDIAMLMIAENLAAETDSGEYDPQFAGVSIVGGACEFDTENNVASNVGIAEDTAPFYNGILNHAHEIGHLIGAVHDGDPPLDHLPGSPGAENCPWDDGYLMSYRYGSKRHLHWSQCTVDQIHWFLKSGKGNCLFTKEGGKPAQLISTLPGEVVSLDNQCSTVERGAKFHETQDRVALCNVLYCVAPFGRITSSGPALEGTKCGYIGDKWCRDGECVRKE